MSFGTWFVIALLAQSSAQSGKQDGPPIGTQVGTIAGVRSQGQTAAPSATPRALAAAAAIVPGLVLHGAGHYVTGEKRAALRLLTAEGIGVAAAGVGVLTLGLSGASRYLAAPAIATLAGGAGLFVLSALADIYGVLAPEGGTGRAPKVAPVVDAAFRGRYVRDPRQPYTFLYGPSLDMRWRAFSLRPSAWLSDVGANRRLRVEGAYRLGGPRPDVSAHDGSGDGSADGSFLDIVVAATHHRGGDLGYTLRGGEAVVAGRLDLRRIAPTLTGAFVDGHAGFGIVSDAYDTTSATDRDELLLLGFGFGMYIGHAPAPWGELRAYYNHRKDDYAGGLLTTGLQSGMAGHFGAEALFFPHPRWGLYAEGQVGSAYIAGLGLVHRYGEVR